MFIAIEGVDGVGKTTQALLTTKILNEKGINTKYVREPGGLEVGENIRNIILNNNFKISNRCEALLYAAARCQIIEDIIKPYLDDGFTVISDRFVLSSLVYQGIGRGIGVKEVRKLNEFACSECENFFSPDLTIILTTSEKTYDKMINRKLSQNNKLDRLENSGEEFFKTIYKSFNDKDFIRKCSDKAVEFIDTTDKSIEDINDEIIDIIMKYLK